MLSGEKIIYNFCVRKNKNKKLRRQCILYLSETGFGLK